MSGTIPKYSAALIWDIEAGYVHFWGNRPSHVRPADFNSVHARVLTRSKKKPPGGDQPTRGNLKEDL